MLRRRTKDRPTAGELAKYSESFFARFGK